MIVKCTKTMVNTTHIMADAFQQNMQLKFSQNIYFSLNDNAVNEKYRYVLNKAYAKDSGTFQMNVMRLT